MIFDDIKLHYPNIWIQTTDSSRIIDIITSTINKEFYTIDFHKGFGIITENTFKQVLVEDPTYEITGKDKYTVTFDLAIAIDYLYTLHKTNPTQRTLIIDTIGDPTQQVQQMSGWLNTLRTQHRTAFWSNNINELTFQTIFISPTECPKDYNYLFHTQEDVHPTITELTHIINHITQNTTKQIITEPAQQIAKAALGLTESEFIHIALNSITQTTQLTADHVYKTKTANIKKHGILEIIKPQIGFEEIAGLDNIKDIINRTAKLRQNPQQAKEYGIIPIRRLLMIGIPGTGKSAICQATAKQLNLDLARTGISQVMNSYIGQSEANMRAVFKQIKALTPLCVWIDEFGRDLSGGASSSNVDGGTTDRVHGEFLTGLQELPEETFLLCAANQLDALRPEMLRADRFDKIMFVGLPSHNERKTIFQIHLNQIKTDHQYNYDTLAENTQYMTGAEIVTLIKETKFYTTTETLQPITTNDILQRIPHNKNIIWLKHQDMVKTMYAYALEQWEWASTQQQQEAEKILGRTQTQKNSARMILN